MIDFLDMDSNKLVISEFYENDSSGKYDYNTVYQRDKVWSEEKKSFLIDSILKNYPIPPVFLRMKIDEKTGITKYDVIDGKQRLTTIKDFIEGKIMLPDDFGDDKIGNSELNGASFEDLNKYEKYRKQFWRYRIPVIFIETEDNDLVKHVFDRLNRNGEPLVPQELRHATYGETQLYSTIDELVRCHKWKPMFDKILETERMEDDEFVSEMMFVLLEKDITSYTKNTLDDLYKKWKDVSSSEIIDEYNKHMQYIDDMGLSYDSLKINKVSHLYAIWVLGVLGNQQNIDSCILKGGIEAFYNAYAQKDKTCIGSEEYKASMSSNTKSVASRRKRINALIDFLKNEGIEVCFKLN